jgi:hypothetical protein
VKVESYLISKNRLTRRLDPNDHEWSWAVKHLEPEFNQGDELWYFDEPAPSGVNAGAMGIAVVRGGEPILTTITAIH